MSYPSQIIDVSFDWQPSVITIVTFALLIIFWVNIGLGSIGITIPFVQAFLGIILLTLIPGGLLTQLLGVRSRSVGEFTIFAIGLSLVTLSIVTVLASVVLPIIGIQEPLSFIPLASILTALIAVMALFIWVTDEDSLVFHVSLSEPIIIYVLYGFLPLFAVIGAWQMNEYNINYGMGIFVLIVAFITILSATRLIQPQQYPVLIFLVTVSVLLHRNLAATHVVGADIQYNFFLSTLIADSHQWTPDIGGSLSTLPVVAAVPVTYSMVTGLDLTTIFTIVYPVIFAIVPVGIYYLASDVFDVNIALYGSLFFVFYHGTFYLTPGKQQLSEIFIVLLLLLYFRRNTYSNGEKAAAVLLAIGLIQSHYGSTYVFGLSVFAASIGFIIISRFTDEFQYRISPFYPISFLAGATTWYAYASSELIETLIWLPFSVITQIMTFGEGPSAGSGSSYVQGQEAVLEQVTLLVYILLTLLIALGLIWKTLIFLNQIRRGTPLQTKHVEFTSLALLLFAFLGTSYIFIVDLWADRVYQMVLLVLAPFAVVGYYSLKIGAERILGISSVNWSPIAVVLAVLFVINAGLAGAAMGTPSDYTFGDDVHDYSFSDDEIEGAQWIEGQPEIEPIETAEEAEKLDEDELVPIYTDRTTSQLFRAVTPEGHYNVDVIMVKDEWDETFDPEETRDGYVFIRHNAIDDGDPDEVSISSLSTENVDEIIEDRSIVFQNDDVTIVEPAEETNEDSTNASTGKIGN